MKMLWNYNESMMAVKDTNCEAKPTMKKCKLQFFQD